MPSVITKIRDAGVSPSAGGRSAGEEIQSRYSAELVIALSGPVGSGVPFVRGLLKESLEAHGYEVVAIKVSAKFAELAASLNISTDNVSSGEFNRISELQNLGNSIRRELGDDIGAQIAMQAIALDRTERHPGVELQDIKPGRIVYVIDQLKNPSEAALLRDVYGNMFYLIGVLGSYERRKQNLSRDMEPAQAEGLIERDRAEVDGRGQQLERTLKLADYFVRNAQDNTQDLGLHLSRLIDLIHGRNGITPTIKERGMYAAHSAAARSACLSRQVGAAIVDPSGNIIATGCNDVPKAGGGLYEQGEADHRCVFLEGGLCFNDKYKDKLRDEISDLLQREGVDVVKSEQLASQIRSKTRMKDLIEFSRAVHAEMDAIISAARKGGNGVQNCILFTTTYPCHNCARHIVAAGISAVYFIEPYGKSLASDLHSDSIAHDNVGDPASPTPQGKVAFAHFDGVAPRRFLDLFHSVGSRKDSNGKAIKGNPLFVNQRAPELLDNYRQLEAKITERMEKKLAANTSGPGAA